MFVKVKAFIYYQVVMVICMGTCAICHVVITAKERRGTIYVTTSATACLVVRHHTQVQSAGNKTVLSKTVRDVMSVEWETLTVGSV